MDETLKLLVQSARLAQEYASVPLEEFLKDQLRQDAVAFRLIVLGELAKKVPKEMKGKFPEVPWKDMARTRDFLAHRGYEASAQRLWVMAAVEIPIQVLEPLKGAL